MSLEISKETEWVCYNDLNIASLKESWFGIIENCIDMASYPTVLFYEKLDENEKYEES